jgi:protein tyrosine/serine phosphatase
MARQRQSFSESLMPDPASVFPHPERVPNFRDFGGYAAAGGRRVRTGRLYRSGSLARADAQDASRLAALGIRIHADLRRPDEREAEPAAWTGQLLLVSELGREMRAPHVEFLERMEDSNPARAEDWMRDYYRTALFRPQHIALFSQWFQALDTMGETDAALVNCAAGKDRTGLLCALTHAVLGVGDDDIMADYMATNVAARVEERLPEVTAALNARAGVRHPPEVYRAFLGVREVYFHDAMAALHAHSGSVEGYLDRCLGVDEAMRVRLHARLTEIAPAAQNPLGSAQATG